MVLKKRGNDDKTYLFLSAITFKKYRMKFLRPDSTSTATQKNNVFMNFAAVRHISAVLSR